MIPIQRVSNETAGAAASKGLDRSRKPKGDLMSAVAGVLVLIWLVMVVIAVIGLVRGHLDWARLRNRQHAGWLLVASFVVFVLIGSIAPDQPPDGAETQTTTNSTTSTRAATPSPVTTTATASPTTSLPPTTAPTVPESALVPPVPSAPTRSPTPLPFVPPPPTPRFVPPPPAPPATDAYYPNCAAARAAGAAPMHRGEPGYRSGLDRDNDGVACE
ncbi:excalibur calcium-binding domain-containing protein [Nocardia brasiliensis]|uniref:excalibur calcium-binding domain-containing protein n=1 Tax=Nocardia brasiliensis TaxID=37326 RepID=UPI00366FECDB